MTGGERALRSSFRLSGLFTTVAFMAVPSKVSYELGTGDDSEQNGKTSKLGGLAGWSTKDSFKAAPPPAPAQNCSPPSLLPTDTSVPRQQNPLMRWLR